MNPITDEKLKQAVVEAIVASKVSGPAKLEAVRLVEGWIDYAHLWPDTADKLCGVECLWYIQLGPKTYVVGVIDRISYSPGPLLFSEWKTRRAPKLKLNGEPYKGDDEGSWLEEISGGPQLAVYALAARDGAFHTASLPHLPHIQEQYAFITLAALAGAKITEPTILVRCAVKSSPVDIWPMKPQNGVFQFPTAVLNATRDALTVKAAQIRTARKLGVVPWQLMGYHCKTYNRECEHTKLCREHTPPPIEPKGWQHEEDATPDPGYRVTKLLELDVHDPELVVLSQSAYQTFSRCMEKGRIDTGGHVKGETSYELEVGSAFHEGVAEFYRQLK